MSLRRLFSCATLGAFICVSVDARADAGSGTARPLTNDPVRSVAGGEAQGAPSWSPDGKTLAFALAPDAVLNDASRARIALLDIGNGTTHHMTAHDGHEGDPRFSPEGDRIAYAHSSGDDQITLVQTYVTAATGGDGSAVTERYDRAVRDFA